MDNSRDLRIDYAKTVAIILVVVGHSVQYVFARDSFDDNLIFRYIYIHFICHYLCLLVAIYPLTKISIIFG